MKSYKIDIKKKDLVNVKTGKTRKTFIVPKPGEVIDFEGTRLMAVEDYKKEDCSDCVVHENDNRLRMAKSKKNCICQGTSCTSFFRRDRKSIHYEEVKE